MRILPLLRPSAVILSGLLLASIPGCSCAQSSHTAAAQAQAKKIAALKDLHDSGVLSDEEYAQKLAALQPQARSGSGAQAQKLAALKDLRDSGVLSEEEYQSRLAALTGGASPQGRDLGAHATEAEVMRQRSLTPTVPHQVMDQAWGMPWGTVVLPAGWGFNGGVVHADMNSCGGLGDSPMYTAESPDKQLGITILPALKTNWSTDPQMMRSLQGSGCPVVQVSSAAEYLTRYILPHLHGRNFQVVGVSDEPQLAQALAQFRQMNAQFDRMSVPSQFMQTRHGADSARVLVTYQEGGQTRHEIASALLTCTDTRMSLPMAGMRNSGMESIECTSPIAGIVHVPDDGTPFTLEALRNSKPDSSSSFFKIVPNPAWNQRMQQEQQAYVAAQNQARQASAGGGDNSQTEFEKQQAIRRGVQDYRSNTINNVYQGRQAANAQVAGGYAAHMGDYNVYTNPNTGQQVQLSNQYKNTYMNQYGTVGLQTNSASNPGVNWTQLVPKY